LPKLPTLVEEYLQTGDPLLGYGKMIQTYAEFFVLRNISLRTMVDYEVVCKSVLHKYSRLNTTIAHLCHLENSSPSKKAVKRLNPHVTCITIDHLFFLIYLFKKTIFYKKRFISKDLSKCIRNKRYIAKLQKTEKIALSSNSNAFSDCNPVQSTEEQANPISISSRIKKNQEKGQQFFSAFEEFNSGLQSENGEVLLQEFKTLTGLTGVEKKLNSFFNKASKLLKVQIIGELKIADYVQILKMIEKKISKSGCSIVVVKLFSIF